MKQFMCCKNVLPFTGDRLIIATVMAEREMVHAVHASFVGDAPH